MEKVNHFFITYGLFIIGIVVLVLAMFNMGILELLNPEDAECYVEGFSCTGYHIAVGEPGIVTLYLTNRLGTHADNLTISLNSEGKECCFEYDNCNKERIVRNGQSISGGKGEYFTGCKITRTKMFEADILINYIDIRTGQRKESKGFIKAVPK